MPQVKTQDLGKALDMVADKVKVTKETIPASKLKKSQKELIQSKVKGIAKKYDNPLDMKPLIISKDNHIVDGHHRWGAAIYKWGEDVKIPVHRINLSVNNAIKLYKQIADTINEAMSIAARKKMARKSKSKLKRGTKKRIKKMKKKRSNSDLQKAAIRKAKTILMQKMMKKAPADMTMVDKMKFSQKIEKKPGKIQKIAKKILPKLKQAEAERVKKMRSKNVQKANEDITIPINVGDTVLGGKFKNKRIVVKSIDKNEKGDITINGKPLLKFRLVNESTGASIQCSNCNHSWEIEVDDDRPYFCHNCGYDAQSQKVDLVGLKNWKDSLNEANAVSGGKVHKFITGKNLTFKGKKYSNLYFEVLRIDNKSKLVTLKILSPKELFGKELDVPFKTIRRGPFLKTDTSGLGEGVWSKSAITNMNRKSMAAKYFLSDENGNILPSPYRLKTISSVHKTFKISKTWGGFDGVMHPKIVNVHDLKNDGKVVDQYNWTKQGAFLKDIESKYINYKNIEKGLGESTINEACWKGYKQVGGKKKNGKMVPNCVPINEIPMGDLQKIDTFADKKLNPMDVVLTGKHFFDRLNDPRNGKEISSAELIGFFKRLSKKKDDFVKFLDQYNSLVAVDDRTNINIPFMKQANKAIAKTVMRKKDFKSSDKKLDI